MAALVGYFRKCIDAICDPLLREVGPARNADANFALHERGEQCAFGSGEIFELVMYQHEIRVRPGSGWLTVPAGNDTLQRVAMPLSDILITEWRAYGWASFGLGYLLHGLPDVVGAAPLLHLVVPAREVLLGVGIAEFRAVRRADLTTPRSGLFSLRAELLKDPKEIFEHAISVQVAQDGLRAVCDTGSVRVTEFMAVENRSGVQHLSSRRSWSWSEHPGMPTSLSRRHMVCSQSVSG
jgi:hypothetical protein